MGLADSLAKAYYQSGGIGGGGSFADYNPSAAPGGSGLFSGGQPAPGQMNFQVTDAQKANLLSQQQMRDQMVRQQPAPQQQMQQQRSMSPLLQQQMMRQQQPMYNPMQRQSGGLQAALMQMMGRYNQPMQRQQFMPQYQSQAAQYRPDMGQAQQNLNRTATTNAQAQAAAQAKLQPATQETDDDAAFKAWQRQQYMNSMNNRGD
jgi:hypothetical protein